MEVARSACYHGDELDLESFFLLWFVYVVYVGDGFQSDGVYGVLTLYEL